MKIAVVGLGHVGMPLAVSLANAEGVAGVFCVDTDIDTAYKRFMALEASQDEPGLFEAMKSAVHAGKLKVVDYSCCAHANVVIICVETPVSDLKQPKYSALADAVLAVANHITDGTLVIVESTIAPGTMESLVVPLLEEHSGLTDGISLYVAHCPERISPGESLRSLADNPRILGCTTETAKDFVYSVYSKLGPPLYFTDAKTAEVVKTAENAYRDVQIAFANDLAWICMEYGVDVWEVRNRINSCPGRNVLLPGIGVGGHCIPKDPWLLLHGTGLNCGDLIRTARRVNERAVEMAAQFIEELYPKTAPWVTLKVLILGVAYKADVGDARNSPSLALGERLEFHSGCGSKVRICYHDPHVKGRFGGDLATCFTDADIVVLAVPHKEYYLGHLEQYASLTHDFGGTLVNCCGFDVAWPREYYRLYDRRGG